MFVPSYPFVASATPRHDSPEPKLGCVPCCEAIFGRRNAGGDIGLTEVAPRRAVVPDRTVLFTKESTDTESQYLLGNVALFGPPYPRNRNSPNRGAHRTIIGQETQSTVYERRNPDAPVVVKVARFSLENSAKVLDDIALKVLTEAPEDVVGHFAVEVRHDKLKDGRPCVISRKINGCTLKQYFKDPRMGQKISVDSLPGMVEGLRNAVAWLNHNGFVHQDIHRGNVMIDYDNGNLVLIDFGMAQVAGAHNPTKDDFTILDNFLNDNIRAYGEQYRRCFAKAQAQAALDSSERC